MKNFKVITISMISLILLSGCAWDGIAYDTKAGLAKVSNAERTFVVDYNSTPPLERCLEPVGPVALLNDSEFSTTVKGGTEKITNAEINIKFDNAESIGKIYEVNGILQYMHGFSYRLCEARMNGYIDELTYKKLLGQLISDTKSLLLKKN